MSETHYIRPQTMTTTTHPTPTTPARLPMRADFENGGFIIDLPGGGVLRFTKLDDAMYAADHNGELPRPLDLTGLTDAQRRAAYLRATAGRDMARNTLTGHFRGGDRGDN